MELIDSHAHLDHDPEAEASVTAVLERAVSAGVGRIVLVGLWRKPGDFGQALALARARPELLSATVGVHPHDCAQVPAEDWATLEALAADPLVRAVGETGLDYHYDHSPREEQRRWFRHQLELARRLGKPVVVHTREADDDTFALLAEAKPDAGVIHCFTGGPARARAYLELGLYLSVAGVVTFKNATDLQEAVKLVPLDRLLIETDTPFLAPIPHRGKRNEPAHVRLVAAQVAALKGLPVEEIAARTSENARRIFGLPA